MGNLYREEESVQIINRGNIRSGIGYFFIIIITQSYIFKAYFLPIGSRCNEW